MDVTTASPSTGTAALVRTTIDAMAAGPSPKVGATVALLTAVDQTEAAEVLFDEVVSAADGLDLAAIVATDRMPDPVVTARIVKAVRAENVQALCRAVPGSMAELLVTLAATVVALEQSPRPAVSVTADAATV